MKIRIATRNDLESINSIRKFISEEPEDNHTLDAFNEDIITEEEWQVTFVCEIHGNIVGYLNLGTHCKTKDNEQIAMLQLFVLKKQRNKGIGYGLINFAKEYCNQTNKFIGIVLTVLKDNPAKRLYEKCGFNTTKDDGGYWMMIGLK